MLASLCQALSHPVRLRLIQILAQQSDWICGEVVHIDALSQATVLGHLRSLQRAGFIQGQVDGPNRCYQLNTATLDTFKRLVERL